MLDATKSVPRSSTPAEREAFVKLLVDIRGPHYAIGYLKHMYQYAELTDTDERVQERFRQELIQEKFLALVDKKDVDTYSTYC